MAMLYYESHVSQQAEPNTRDVRSLQLLATPATAILLTFASTKSHVRASWVAYNGSIFWSSGVNGPNFSER